MMQIARGLDRLWFADASPTRLALLRIATGWYVFKHARRRSHGLLGVAGSDPTLFRPIGVVSPLRRPLPLAAWRAVLGATFLANVAFLVGWQHRYSGPAFSGLLLWVLTYRNSWSTVYHSDNLLVLHALILGLTPAADALSLDALTRWVRSRGAARSAAAAPTPGRGGDWQFGWPIRLLNVVTVLTYLLAGVAKVAGPLGWRWGRGEAFRGQLAADGLRKSLLGDPPPPTVLAFRDKPIVFRVLGILSLVVELAAPLALLDRRLAALWALGAYLMHRGILAIMGIRFGYPLSGIAFLSFVDLERLGPWLVGLARRLRA